VLSRLHERFSDFLLPPCVCHDYIAPSRVHVYVFSVTFPRLPRLSLACWVIPLAPFLFCGRSLYTYRFLLPPATGCLILGFLFFSYISFLDGKDSSSFYFYFYLPYLPTPSLLPLFLTLTIDCTTTVDPDTSLLVFLLLVPLQLHLPFLLLFSSSE
jgi:hypothetical protein